MFSARTHEAHRQRLLAEDPGPGLPRRRGGRDGAGPDPPAPGIRPGTDGGRGGGARRPGPRPHPLSAGRRRPLRPLSRLLAGGLAHGGVPLRRAADGRGPPDRRGVAGPRRQGLLPLRPLAHRRRRPAADHRVRAPPGPVRRRRGPLPLPHPPPPRQQLRGGGGRHHPRGHGPPRRPLAPEPDPRAAGALLLHRRVGHRRVLDPPAASGEGRARGPLVRAQVLEAGRRRPAGAGGAGAGRLSRGAGRRLQLRRGRGDPVRPRHPEQERRAPGGHHRAPRRGDAAHRVDRLEPGGRALRGGLRKQRRTGRAQGPARGAGPPAHAAGQRGRRELGEAGPRPRGVRRLDRQQHPQRRARSRPRRRRRRPTPWSMPSSASTTPRGTAPSTSTMSSSPRPRRTSPSTAGASRTRSSTRRARSSAPPGGSSGPWSSAATSTSCSRGSRSSTSASAWT